MTAHHALVVYESEYGSTRQIAVAIADGIAGASRGDTAVGVAAADHLDPAWVDAVRLLVVGAPTYAFAGPDRQPSLPRQRTRDRAADRTGRVPDSSVREWLDDITRPDHPVVAATFDVRAQMMRHRPGSASAAAKQRLRQRGFEVTDHESFYVTSPEGPLAPGEEERAREWAGRIAADALVAPTPG